LGAPLWPGDRGTRRRRDAFDHLQTTWAHLHDYGVTIEAHEVLVPNPTITNCVTPSASPTTLGST